ncbi:MAG: STAS domain-containing protein [Actinobacteria bacterium]|nr:STAS domain-containing protein [Actinomycetota bacterium]
MELSLSSSNVGERTVLSVAGEVDVYSAPQLRDRLTDLIDSGDSGLVVDLSEVSFLDSTGIGTLVAGLNRAAGAGGGLSLVCNQDRILKLFRITGLEGVFTIYPTLGAVDA